MLSDELKCWSSHLAVPTTTIIHYEEDDGIQNKLCGRARRRKRRKGNPLSSHFWRIACWTIFWEIRQVDVAAWTFPSICGTRISGIRGSCFSGYNSRPCLSSPKCLESFFRTPNSLPTITFLSDPSCSDEDQGNPINQEQQNEINFSSDAILGHCKDEFTRANEDRHSCSTDIFDRNEMTHTKSTISSTGYLDQQAETEISSFTTKKDNIPNKQSRRRVRSSTRADEFAHKEKKGGNPFEPKRDSLESFSFWEGSLSIRSFNMDLNNLAMEDPQRAQDALEVMEQLYAEDPNNPNLVQPNSASYATVIEGWCHGDPDTTSKAGLSIEAPATRTKYSWQQSSDVAAFKAQALLDKMESLPHLMPNELSYLLVCKKWADSVNTDTILGVNAQRAHDVLDRVLIQEEEKRLKEETKTSPQQVATNFQNAIPRQNHDVALLSAKIYSIVLEGWCRRVGKVAHAMNKVERLLLEMEQAHTTRSLSESLEGCGSNADRNMTATRVSKSLKGIPSPNVLTYTSVIGALACSKDPKLATRAMSMLQRMKAHEVEPDMVAYTAILNCWAKTTSRVERSQSAKKALEILYEMEDSYLNEEKYYVKPNGITYATAIKAVGNSLHARTAGLRQTHISSLTPVSCHQTKIDAETAEKKLSPDGVSISSKEKRAFECTIDVATSSTLHRAQLAEEILRHMYRLTENGILHVPPTTSTYNAVIISLSCHSPFGGAPSRLANAKRAEHLLVEMIKRSRSGENGVEPNIRSWGGVLRAWAGSGQPDAGEQAERVLNQLQAWHREGKSMVKANVVCYTTVMNAWARGNASSKVALDSVERLLTEMETQYLETRDKTVRPNKISYVTAMDAFGRKAPTKEEAASRCQAIVDRMMFLYSQNSGYDRPTRIIFNALINAYSKSENPNAASRAEEIFRWMEDQYRAGDLSVKPDEITLCGVLNAWANHAENGGALRAQQILDHIETLSLEERGFSHSIVCHNILLKAWGRSREPDAVKRAEAILNKLLQESETPVQSDSRFPVIIPDITTYSSVINCCAYYAPRDTNGKKEAFDVALRTFERLKLKSLKGDTGKATKGFEVVDGPNNITYGTMLKAIAKLLPPSRERDTLVETLFNECIEDGQVDAFVITQVRGATSSSLFQRLVLEAADIIEKSEDKEAGIQKGERRRRNQISLNDISVEAIVKKIPQSWGRNSLALSD